MHSRRKSFHLFLYDSLYFYSPERKKFTCWVVVFVCRAFRLITTIIMEKCVVVAAANAEQWKQKHAEMLGRYVANEEKKSVVSKWWCRKSNSRLPPYNYDFYTIAFACIWTNCLWTQRQDIEMKTLDPKVRYSFFFINIYINKKQQTNKDNTICCGIQFYRIHCEFALTKETKTRIQLSTARICRAFGRRKRTLKCVLTAYSSNQYAWTAVNERNNQIRQCVLYCGEPL